MGYTNGQVGRIGGRLDTEVESGSSQEGRGDSYPVIGNSFVNVTGQKGRWRHSFQERKNLDPLMIEPPRTVEGIELVLRGDSKTVVDWINGKAKQKVSYRSIETRQIQLMEWSKKGRRLEPKDRRLGGAHLQGTQQGVRFNGGLRGQGHQGMERRVCDRLDQSNRDMRILGWELQ